MIHSRFAWSFIMFSRFIDHQEQESTIAHREMHGCSSGHLLAMALPPHSGCIQLFSCILYISCFLAAQRAGTMFKVIPFIKNSSIYYCIFHTFKLMTTSINYWSVSGAFRFFHLYSLSVSLCTCSVQRLKWSQGFWNQKRENVQFTLKKTASSDASFMAICTSPGIL